MPLEPYFARQLRDNRRGAIAGIRKRAVSAVRGAPRALLAGIRALPGCLGALIRGGARPAAPATAASAATPASPPTSTSPETWIEIPPVTALDAFTIAKATRVPRYSPAGEQRNALLWDRKLHGQVGIDGPDLRTREFLLPVPGFPTVRVRLYLPDSPAPAGGFPAVLAFFGGAFHIGGIDYTSVDAGFRRHTRDAGVAYLAVDYARAPIDRFPTPVEQGYAALDWMFTEARELGIDPERVGITGASSGGNIAAAVTLANRDRANHPLRLQLLEVPSLDLTGHHIDFGPLREMGVPRLLLARELRTIRGRYLAHDDQARTGLASPLLAARHDGLPPAHILTAEYDSLRGDGRAYAEVLQAAGVEAAAIQFQGAPHDAAMYGAVSAVARRWYSTTVAILREGL